MDLDDPKIRKVFFDIYNEIPRGGPGDFDSTARAYRMLTDLPGKPRILDVACGPGMQTMHLAQLTGGHIIALDNHIPFLESLRKKLKTVGLSHRVETREGDMFRLDFEPGSFDLVWSEGAIYMMGFARGLTAWKPLLKKGGYMVVTEPVYFKPNPPEPVRQCWVEEYPEIRDTSGNIEIINESGYRLIGHFPLPEAAWWAYYNPMEERIAELRKKCEDNPLALAVLAECQSEIDIYRDYSDYYGYDFYICQSLA